MRKFLSSFLALGFMLNVNAGAASMVSDQEIVADNTSLQDDKGSEGLTTRAKIVIGAAAMTAVGAVSLMLYNYLHTDSLPQETVRPQERSVISDKQVLSLQNDSLKSLTEFFATREKEGHPCKHPHIVLSSLRKAFGWNTPLRLGEFFQILSPYKSVITIFMDFNRSEHFLVMTRMNLSNIYRKITGIMSENESVLRTLYDVTMSDNSWRLESDLGKSKKEYVEIFELYLNLKKIQDKSYKDFDGILVTKNTSYGDNEKARYYVRVLDTGEVWPKNQKD